MPNQTTTHTSTYRLKALVAALALASLIYLVVAPNSLAHGLFDRADLPIPQWLFGWAAAVVLVISFIALGILWSRPKLTDGHWRPIPLLGRVLGSRPVLIGCSLVGALLLALVVSSGLWGIQDPEHNFAPTFVYVIFWVGLVPVSVLLGDVFRAFNPWKAIATAAAWATGRTIGRTLKAPFAYPSWLGYWPAVVGLIAFAMLELVTYGGTTPKNIAIASLVYTAITFAGMALFGIERWLDRGEAYSVYFNLFSRVSAFEKRDGCVGVRLPLSGLVSLPNLPGIAMMIAVMIGTVSFDGASEGPLGLVVVPKLQMALESTGLGPTGATQLALGLTMVITVLLVLAFFRLGVAGVNRISGGSQKRGLALQFAPTLVPIALAYVGAHYLTLLLFQGQSIVHLASDPLGNGSNFLGTSTMHVNHGIVGATTVWYAQIGLVVSGHVAALSMSHDKALVLFRQAGTALRSQISMLVVMIGFTVFALWLLSQANL